MGPVLPWTRAKVVLDGSSRAAYNVYGYRIDLPWDKRRGNT